MQIPVFELVQLEKPKIRPLLPKAPKEIIPPAPEPPAPKPPEIQSKKPLPSPSPVPKKPIVPLEEKQPEPEEDAPEEEVPETKEKLSEAPPQILPQMVMEDLTDPKLKFWISRVKKKIDLQWNPPGGIGAVGQIKVTIVFRVARSGMVSSPAIKESSGFSELDKYAINTILRVGNLPPIPPNYQEKNELEIAYIFPYIGD